MILAIDTSLGTAVAVIDRDGVVRAEAASGDPLGHAEVIGTLLRQAVDAAGAPRADITHVAAGMGPGPFTGLRIGIAAARAFGLARRVPVVPVPSHDAIALGALLAAGIEDRELPPFAVVTDARRREFAYTLYDGLDDDGLPVRRAEPQLVPRGDLDARLDELGAARLEATAVPAAMLGLAAARALDAGRTIGPSEPLYLRSPDVTLPHAPKRVGT